MVPNRLVVSGHVQEKFALVDNFEAGLGTCWKGLGQLNGSAATLLVEGD